MWNDNRFDYLLYGARICRGCFVFFNYSFNALITVKTLIDSAQFCWLQSATFHLCFVNTAMTCRISTKCGEHHALQNQGRGLPLGITNWLYSTSLICFGGFPYMRCRIYQYTVALLLIFPSVLCAVVPDSFPKFQKQQQAHDNFLRIGRLYWGMVMNIVNPTTSDENVLLSLKL